MCATHTPAETGTDLLDRHESPLHQEPLSRVRHAVDPLDSDHVAIDHIQNPVAVNSQPVVPASVESRGGERLLGQACGGSTDRAHTVLVGHEAAS
jgi:hypothetical protein